MANSLVIRKGTSLAKSERALRAAQYVRMSTDYQRYSIQNQAAAIATFAQQKNIKIVRTYMDEGRSGLRIKGRPGLIELIDDVRSGEVDFDHILVYDISRWGRFQDVDESAYYEFICKQNGIRVAYCAEQFDNDGSLLSSIAKNIKRVMAAEFSRELSAKVHAGHCRIASCAEPTDEERVKLHKAMLAYGGTYSLSPGKVVNHIDIEWDGRRLGTDQVRFYTIDGDKLVIKTAPNKSPIDGREGVGILTFERVKPLNS